MHGRGDQQDRHRRHREPARARQHRRCDDQPTDDDRRDRRVHRSPGRAPGGSRVVAAYERSMRLDVREKPRSRSCAGSLYFTSRRSAARAPSTPSGTDSRSAEKRCRRAISKATSATSHGRVGGVSGCSTGRPAARRWSWRPSSTRPADRDRVHEPPSRKCSSPIRTGGSSPGTADDASTAPAQRAGGEVAGRGPLDRRRDALERDGQVLDRSSPAAVRRAAGAAVRSSACAFGCGPASCSRPNNEPPKTSPSWIDAQTSASRSPSPWTGRRPGTRR